MNTPADTDLATRGTHDLVPPRQLAAWIAFLEAHTRVLELLEHELRADEGLQLTWYDVMVHLSEAPGRRLRMQELADAILLSKSGLTRLIDRMEQAGIVQRAACPDDRRGTFAELTPAGMERLRATAPTHLRGVRAHFADLLDDDEAEVLERLLGRIGQAARDAR